MRIEIMIDKEQKIGQATLDSLESELYRNLRPCIPEQQFVSARAAPTALS